MKRIAVLAALLLWAFAAPAAPLETLSRLPLAFEANLGQADARVKFLARIPGLRLDIGSGEAVYRVQGRLASSAVTMALVESRPEARAHGLGRLPGHSHYLAPGGGEGDLTGVPHFSRVEIRGVYRGIDLAFHGDAEQLEYDFIVAPGADPRAIAIDVRGAERLELDRRGRLVIHTAAGRLAWKRPVAYQVRGGERIAVASRYVMRGKSRIGFRLGRYDRNLPLVIDPVLSYATLVGGTGVEFPFAIAVDANGEAVITGSTGTADYPTTADAYDRASGGIFVTRLNAAGTALVYSTFLGPGRGTGVALHGGHAFVTGRTSTTALVTPGAVNHGVTGQGLGNAFVAKLRPDGSGLEYGAILGRVAEDPHIAVDASGNAHVAATASSSVAFPTTAGAYQPHFTRFGFPAFQADHDVVYAKLDATGSTLLYASYLGSSELDEARGIAVDAAGKAYVTGATEGRAGAWGSSPAAAIAFPTTAGAYQATFTGALSPFVAKFDATQGGPASLVYSTLVGDGGSHQSMGIAVDSGGSAYITGSAGANFPLTPGAYGVASPQGAGAFVARLDAAGSALAWSAMIVDAFPAGIALDGAGHAFVAGTVLGPGFAVVDGLPGTAGGSVFLTKLAPSGAAAVYSTRLQGRFGEAVAVDGRGAAYVLGDVHQVPFTATAGAFQSFVNGTFPDLFVSKVATNRPPVADAGADQSLFAGQSFSLDGSGSFDPDGDPLTFAWSEAGQALSGAAIVSGLARPVGAHLFTLTVGDGAASASDSVVVTVRGSLTVDLFGGGSAVRVASSDGRIDCTPTSNRCFAAYDAPATVTLTASPDTGWTFSNWSNACTGSAGCTATVDGNVRVGAHFAVQQVPLGVSANAGGAVTSIPAGIACGAACSIALPYGTSVELKAAADAGHRFVGWSGDCAGSADTCTLTLIAASAATATFAEITLDAIAVSPPHATIAVGGRQRFTIVGRFSDGTTRPLSADRSVDGTDDRTCAILRNGTVKCFGGLYAAPTTIPAFERAAMLAAGSGQVCALFGDGTVNCDGAPIALSSVASIAAGAGNQVCALLEDATLRCWSTPSPPVPEPLPGNAPPVAIAADGGQPACAVLADGKVGCVGHPSIVAGVEDAIATAVGVFHACALLGNGRVKCWGDNDWGQLGRGTTHPTSQPQPADFVLEEKSPSTTGPVEGVVALVSGDYYMCSLDAQGTVKCWGAQVGPGGLTQVAEPLAKVVTHDAVAVAAGAFHACATRADATLDCWGFNIGNTLLGNPSSRTPVTIGGMANLVTAAWSTSPPATSAIAANGIAAGRAQGTATIVAHAGGLTASATLTVVNTPAGSNVRVQPEDAQSGTTPVALTFSQVTAAGSTSVAILPGTPPNLQPQFAVGSPPQYYEIATTAGYSPPITVCISYAGISFNGPPQLFHFENGQWVDRTTSVDTSSQVVCGEVGSLSPFAIVERVNRAPIADAGDDAMVECTSPTGAPVRLDGSRSSDPDGDALTFEWSGAFGRATGPSPTVTLPVGTTVATLSVSDGRAAAGDTVSVTVRDTTAPDVAASVHPAVLWPPNHEMVPVTVAASARDRCDASPRCAVAAVASNEPGDGRGDGRTGRDWRITGALTVELRAERSGGGTGRIYGIRLDCRDAAGNAAARVLEVKVPLSR